MHSTLAYSSLSYVSLDPSLFAIMRRDLWFLMFFGSNAYVHIVDLRMAFSFDHVLYTKLQCLDLTSLLQGAMLQLQN